MESAWEDPVVEETRARGQAYTTRLGGDIHRIFEDLRGHQLENGEVYVTVSPGLIEDADPRSMHA